MGKNEAESTQTDVYAARLARLRAAGAPLGFQTLLVTNPIDVGYLTGFLGGDSYLVVGPGRPIIVSDFRYEEELEPIRPVAEIHIRRKGLLDAVTDVIRSLGQAARPLGIQADYMPVAERDTLAGSLGASELVATAGLIAALRRRKDEHEIRLIRKAIRIQEAALEAVLPLMRKRVRKGKATTELDVAALLEAEMKRRGASEPGFKSIVAAKANGSFPHYRPGPVKIARDKPVLIDWGAIYRGYHGDMTRVFVVGKWPRKIREIYDIVRDAHLAAAEALSPGRSTHEIDGIARAHITEQGFGPRFGHGLGHGMGMNGHEDPRLNPLFAPLILQPGDVVTIEPGIYLPGVGGVRIEDDFLVTEDGARNLCSLPTDRDWATL